MKKVKSFFLVMLLSVTLATNSFATGSIIDLTSNIFDSITNAVVSLFTKDADDDCPVRTCGDCPRSNPSCRPPKD